jgi:hypothetical protein
LAGSKLAFMPYTVAQLIEIVNQRLAATANGSGAAPAPTAATAASVASTLLRPTVVAFACRKARSGGCDALPSAALRCDAAAFAFLLSFSCRECAWIVCV